MKLHPEFHETELTEDHLNHFHLIRGIDTLFGKRTDSSEPNDIESKIITNLTGGKVISSSSVTDLTPHYSFGADSTWDEEKQKLDALPSEQCNTYEIFAHGNSLKSGIETLCFPDFGLFLMFSPTLFLSIRCGPVGQNGNGGHAHNDALSIELQINGVDHITDPGSYLYTPLPEIRNAYRSVKAHFAPYVDQQEPNSIDLNLFHMGRPGSSPMPLFW